MWAYEQVAVVKTSNRTIITPAFLHSISTREVWIAITILVAACGKYLVLFYNHSKFILSSCNILFITLNLIRDIVWLCVLLIGKNYFRLHNFNTDGNLEDLEINRAYQIEPTAVGSLLDRFITTEGIL